MPTPEAGWTLVDPATEEPFRTVEFTRPADLERLLTRARAVQREWREMPVADRVSILGAMVPAFRVMAEAVAGEITAQTGNPLAQARAEIETMIDRVEMMGRLAAGALADEPWAARSHTSASGRSPAPRAFTSARGPDWTSGGALAQGPDPVMGLLHARRLLLDQRAQ